MSMSSTSSAVAARQPFARESSADDLLRSLERAQQRGIERLGRKALALERLVEISRQISILDRDVALRAITHSVVEITGTDRGALMLRGEDGRLEPAFAVNLQQEEIESQGFLFSRSVAQRAIAEGQVIVVENAPSSSVCERTSIAELGLMALLAIPLRVRDRTLGVIYADTRRDAAGRAAAGRETLARERPDLDLLAALGAQAAIALDNALLYERLQEDHLHLRRSVEESFRFDQILYRSAAMDRVCRAIRQVLDSDVPVLIQGETGTGKELVARAIHFNGRRKDRRLLSQNSGALPDSILESELFGHRRGAFSGAVENKVGLFEAADGGTVFLDEIGEASPALQVRLLRLLETGTFRRVGETADRRADVRILAATHRDLEEEVRHGRFRSDLFYRLSVFPIRIPPLRERREDVEVLVEHFLGKFNESRAASGKSVDLVPRATLERLLAHSWPGNVRELQNVVQRLMIQSPGRELVGAEEVLCERTAESGTLPAGTLPAGTLPAGTQAAASVAEDLADTEELATLEEVERRHVRRVLDQVGGNRSQAARILGLKRGTFRWRLKKLGLD